MLTVIGIVWFLFRQYSKPDPVLVPGTVTATTVLEDNLKDPLVTSRAYIVETSTGSIGDFVGYSPMSQDDWLHSFTHEES
jgi:hypothetical protein